MRLPTRRSERLRGHPNEGPMHVTKDGLQKMKLRLKRIEEIELPQSIEDVRITAEFGDFSENAEYQEAKARMRRLHAQVFNLKEKIKHAVIIEPNQAFADTVQLGSHVVLESNGTQRAFEIVGPQESDPIHGRISNLSPLGSSLIGRKIGETVSGYVIKEINI